MLSFFGSSLCKRCAGELTEIEDRLAQCLEENKTLRLELEKLRIFSDSQNATRQSAESAAPVTVYIASRNRSHFHRPSCVWMENLSEKNLREFASHDEAVEAGYKPCKTCCA